MVKQRSSLRQVPWQNWEHWKWVASELFSDSPDRVSAALDRITAWQSKGKVPIAVETSAALISIHQTDPAVNRGLPQESALPEELLRMMYAMAIQRLVNGVVDQSQKRTTTSVADRAEFAGLPRLLVDIRHETAHTELPGLSLLQVASKQALAWLKLQYWNKQRETLVKARVELKSKLVEHCCLVIESLSPSAAVDDCQLSKHGEEFDEKTKNLLDVVPRETLRVKKEQRNGLCNELLDLSLSSTTDLISVMVDDGLLEQDRLPSLDAIDDEQLVRTESADNPDLISASDCAWKFTIRELSLNLPRFPGMLLVAIIKHINNLSSCLQTGIGSSIDEGISTLSQASGHIVSDTMTSSSRQKERLIFWCAWLLGKRSSRDTNPLSGEECVGTKSKLQKISDALSVRADLSKDLLRELLRLCLHTSNGRGPLVELVPLIAVQLGSNQFQCRAFSLARLGTVMQRAQRDVIDRSENQEPGVMIAVGGLHEGSLKEMAMSSPASEGDDRSPSSKLTMESDLEIARSQQRAFLGRVSLQETDPSTRDDLCCKEPTADSAVRSSQTVRSAIISHVKHHKSLHPTNLGPSEEVSDVRKWSVVKNWRPCAIGMIPSPCHWIGIMPSLEMRRNADGDELAVSKQPGGAGREENPPSEKVSTSIGRDRLAAVDTVELSMGKRVNGEHLDVSSSRKRVKNSGCHVQFERRSPGDVDEKGEASLGRTFLEGPWSLNEASIPQKEQMIDRGSLIQGCLLQHGMFMPVTPQQLESLQSAVHVL